MNDDDDDWIVFKELRKEGQRKRARNREHSPTMLTGAGIAYVAKNGGAHLVIQGNDGETVDFWPGTGLWTTRGGQFSIKGRGVRNLIKHLKRL